MEIFGNLDLAKIIEEVSAIDDAAYVQAMKVTSPKNDWDTFQFKNGIGCFVGNSPFTGTHGFGTDSQVHNLNLLKEIESYFKIKNVSPMLSIAAVVEPKIFKLLFENYYGVIACRNVYTFSENQNKNIKSDSDLEIREVNTQGDLKLWLKVVSDGFAGKALDQPDPISSGQSIKKGNRFFIAYLNGIPAGASALYINGDVARLGGMGTLTDFRGKGIQTAMIRYRTQVALDNRCKYIFSDTQPGNNSQRNLERNNFKLAYVRTILRKNSGQN